ncbi:hypothetical protein QBC46DRAFT_430769 [Diplogelasinospora grovesii]|uniref:BZIP domain-containing protein n=1 Tax=Diplogelasinospora grovesii TaxID=303347 RepID=A0AAN6RYI5_9PEZI|nr:hypothetical protein QBC46DRAFT_430769 [Diplogelasinospora grovesii]
MTWFRKNKETTTGKPKAVASLPATEHVESLLGAYHTAGCLQRQDHGGIPVDDGDGRGQQQQQQRQFGSRTSGVRNILNPSEQQRGALGSSPSPSLLPRPPVEGEGSQPVMGTRPYRVGGSPSHLHAAYKGQGAGASHSSNPNVPPPQHPPGSSGPPGQPGPPLGPPLPPTDRGSPSPSHPLAAMRRILTPKSPLGMPPPHARTAVPGHDVSPLGGPPSLPGLQGQDGSSSSRPSSNRLNTGRNLSASGLGNTRWGPGYLSSLLPGGPGLRMIQMTEGHQHVLTITPTHGEEIFVPVDVHQASKQADEKRQRNAGASARFRLRKKQREEESKAELQKLENQNRDLENRNKDLEAEREFYRNDRNRLREIVARTPGISEWAERGPPSPISSRNGASFTAENSPRTAPPPHQQPQSAPPPPPAPVHPHPQPFTPAGPVQFHPHPSPYGESERPARRRRTNTEPHFPITSAYGPAIPPTSLPPIPPPPPPMYGSSPSPQLSGTPGAARLPPIRFIRSPPPQPPGTSQHCPSYARAPYETGWASGPPRGPAGGGHRKKQPWEHEATCEYRSSHLH